jgi:chromate transporter
MNVFVLFLYLLKATLTTFSGLASLPVLRQDLVLNHHVITDQQLNTAIVVTRTTPGPVGLYVVSVGYFAGGVPGAFAGWLAMIAPALLIIPLIHFVGRHATHPRLRSMMKSVVLASAGLLWVSSVPLMRGAVRDPLTIAILVTTVVLLVLRKLDACGSSWVLRPSSWLRLRRTYYRVFDPASSFVVIGRHNCVAKKVSSCVSRSGQCSRSE